MHRGGSNCNWSILILFQLTLALTSAFGRDSQGATWTLNYLLKTVELTLRTRSSEPFLIGDTVDLLVSLADSKER